MAKTTFESDPLLISSGSTTGSSPIYHEVAPSLADLTDDVRPKSSSLPNAHSRQFQSGQAFNQDHYRLTYDQATPIQDELRPKAAKKMSNTSMFRPYQD